MPSQAASVAFVAGLGTLCYGLAPKVMDNFNTVLVGGVVLTFLVLISELVQGLMMYHNAQLFVGREQNFLENKVFTMMSCIAPPQVYHKSSYV